MVPAPSFAGRKLAAYRQTPVEEAKEELERRKGEKRKREKYEKVEWEELNWRVLIPSTEKGARFEKWGPWSQEE